MPKVSSINSSTTIYRSLTSFYSSLKDENGKFLKWKERKKVLKEQVRSIKKSADLSKGEKVLLTILSVLVAIGLLLLVAALACGIACSGSGAAALLVGLSGGALVIYLLVITLRAIHRSKTKPKKVPESTSG